MKDIYAPKIEIIEFGSDDVMQASSTEKDPHHQARPKGRAGQRITASRGIAAPCSYLTDHTKTGSLWLPVIIIP